MRLVLTIIVFLTTSFFAQAENYIEYHTQIATAEEAIVNEDFKKAGDIYEKVFKQYSFTFSRDAYHALQAAILEKNEGRANRMLKKTIIAGVKKECLFRSALIKTYINRLNPKEFEMVFAKQRSVYLENQNKALHDEWRERFHCEQFAKYGKYPGKTYIECLKENYDKLKFVLMQTGYYPGEKTIGLCNGFYDTLNDLASKRMDSINLERSKNPDNKTIYFYSENIPKECNLDNNFVTPTLLHTGFAYAELKQYLFNAIENGTMHPRDYMYIYYFESGVAKHQKGIHKFYETYAPLTVKNEKYEMLFCYFGACSDILLANKWRAKIGVCTVQIDIRKKQIIEKYGFDFID